MTTPIRIDVRVEYQEVLASFSDIERKHIPRAAFRALKLAQDRTRTVGAREGAAATGLKVGKVKSRIKTPRPRRGDLTAELVSLVLPVKASAAGAVRVPRGSVTIHAGQHRISTQRAFLAKMPARSKRSAYAPSPRRGGSGRGRPRVGTTGRRFERTDKPGTESRDPQTTELPIAEVEISLAPLVPILERTARTTGARAFVSEFERQLGLILQREAGFA